MKPLLKVTGLTVRYGGKVAVQAVDLDVGAQEIVTIVGHNGAGKSSLLSALHGHVPAEGRIELDGKDITLWSPEERLHAGLALVPQGHQVFRGLTVRENLELAGLVREKAARLLELTVLPVRPRLISLLLRMARPHGSGGLVVSPPRPHHKLAARIGTGREVVSRTLGGLQRDGLVVPERGGLLLPQPERLRVEVEAGYNHT